MQKKAIPIRNIEFSQSMVKVCNFSMQMFDLTEEIVQNCLFTGYLDRV